MDYSMTDPSGGYFDPTTGMYVPASNMPTKQQATAPNAFSGTANAIGNALAPALMQGANGAPPMPTPPAGLQSQPGAYTDPTSGLNAPPGMLNRTPGQPGVYTDPTTGQTAPPGMLNKPPVQAALGTQGPQADPYASAPSPASQPGMAAAIAAAKANQQPTAGAAAAAAPAPSGEAPGGATGGPSSDYYSNAQGPSDPAQQKVVSDAANKYGVPLNVANWVGYHESGWNPSATGISTSSGKAQGAWQFMPGTAQQYGLKDPNDFSASTDAAMHYLSDLAKKNGGDWTQAVQQYGTFSTGMGADRDAAAKNGFMAYLGQKPGAAPGPMLAATTTQPAPGPGTGPGGFDPDTDPALARMKAMMQFAGVKPMSTSDKLMAMASGFLGGNGPAKSLAGGFGAIPQMNMEANKQAMSLAQMGIESQYHDALMGLSGQRIGLQADSPAGPQQIGKGPDGKPLYMTPLKNGTMRIDSGPSGAVQGTQNRADVGLQSNLAAGKASETEQVKDTQDDINQMYEAAQEAPTRDMQLNQLQQLVQSGQAGSGPGLAAMKRGIANYFNADLTNYGGPNATGAQLAASIASQQRGSGIMGKNMRTQREFDTVMQGLPNIDSMNPQVLNDTVNRLKNLNDLSHTMAQNFLALPADQRSAMRTNQDQFQAWSQAQAQSWRDKVQQNGGLYGQGASQAPAPGTTPTGGTKGVAPTMRYDQASGQMVPM